MFSLFQPRPTHIYTESPKLKPHINGIDKVYTSACRWMSIKPKKQRIDESLRLSPNMHFTVDPRMMTKLVYVCPRPEDDYDTLVDALSIGNHDQVSQMIPDIHIISMFDEEVSIMHRTPSFQSALHAINTTWTRDLVMHEFIVSMYDLDLGQANLAILNPFIVHDFRVRNTPIASDDM